MNTIAISNVKWYCVSQKSVNCVLTVILDSVQYVHEVYGINLIVHVYTYYELMIEVIVFVWFSLKLD